MDALSSQEINQLIEALQVWEKQPGSEALQSNMFSFLPPYPGFGVWAKQDGDQKMAKAHQEEILRREASVILQAKLLMMRNEALKEELA